MSEQQFRVVFQPYGRGVYVLGGTKIIEAAGRVGLTINTPCGGAGTCQKCVVKITSGPSEPTEADINAFDKKKLKQGWRLACQNSVESEMIIEVPETSRLAGEHQILTKSHLAEAKPEPSIRKVYVELPQPELEDNVADLVRLQRTLGHCKVTLNQLKKLPKLLRSNGFKGTAVLAGNKLINFEATNTTEKCFGVAIDIGTTTMVACLLNLCNGHELAIVSRMNPQISFGDDVLSRINHCNNTANNLDELHTAVITEIISMVDTLCTEAGVEAEHIYEIAFAGNTTMEHLLCGIDPAPLGTVPFAPAFGGGLIFEAAELGIKINDHCLAYVFGVIGGFVGGDTVAGILASELADETEAILFVDIGTNGEIVLAKDGNIMAASTAAGPAFEGTRISCGMRATTGAIEKIIFTDNVHCSTIGNIAPAGLCGSAIIDLVSEMLRAGLICSTGRLLGPNELPESLPDEIKRRVYENSNGQPEFLVAESTEGKRNLKVIFTQKDIRELQLAAGAIRAGINIMLKKAGIKANDLKRVLIAGGFGSFIRRGNAQRIGLLPGEIDHEKINYIGNASLAGAKWALLSAQARKKAEEITAITKHIELSLDTDFQTEFANAMIFPES